MQQSLVYIHSAAGLLKVDKGCRPTVSGSLYEMGPAILPQRVMNKSNITYFGKQVTLK